MLFQFLDRAYVIIFSHSLYDYFTHTVAFYLIFDL